MLSRGCRGCAVLGGLVLVAAAAGCAGGVQGAGAAGVKAQASVALELPAIGNPKYDRFFADVVALQKEVAAVRASIEAAPASLSTALGAPAPMALEPALDRVGAKLFGKVKVAIEVSAGGAVVELVPVKKARITDEDRAVIEAYRKVMLDLAQVPMRLAPLSQKSAGVIKQAIGLASSARQDFMGVGLFTTLPSVLRGIVKVKDAMASIKQDLPVILQKTGTTYLAMKKCMGLEPTVDFKLELPSVGAALAAAVPSGNAPGGKGLGKGLGKAVGKVPGKALGKALGKARTGGAKAARLR